MRTAIVLIIVVVAVVVAWWTMIRMPGRSYNDTPPSVSVEQSKLRDELAADVQMLAGEIGERNVPHYPQLRAAADFIEQSLSAARLPVRRDSYEVAGKRCDNIEAELRGSTSDIVLIGAHYDSVFGAPGANDNGSGVAAMLALARRFAGKPAYRTIRFVAFANEEPPYFLTPQMGSLVYAGRCKQRGDRIVAMLSLETIGYFSNAPGSQRYPLPGLGLFYPTRGNFIGFVGNVSSRRLVRRVIGDFRKHADIPCEGAALPAGVPGVGWSDHWSFWQNGYAAVMVTDTAPFRYPHYHSSADTPDKLDYESMSRVVAGLQNVVARLTQE
jgi:hypothetical protein